jgi:hypothetical protein
MAFSNRKTALVTGAASGFGLEFSKLLASDDFDLILIDNNLQMLNSAKELIISKFGVEVELLHTDLSKPGSADEIYSSVRDKQVEILINNAGYGLFGYFTQTNWQKEEDMINLHVLTLTHLTKLFLRDMVERGSGKIMNVSSLAAFQPGPLMAVYYASKSYILSFSQALANEVKGTGVSITVFCPGQTKTRFQEMVAQNSASQISKSPWIADASKVARLGYRALQSGKIVFVPGFANKFIVQLNRFVPGKVSASLVRILQEKVRN